MTLHRLVVAAGLPAAIGVLALEFAHAQNKDAPSGPICRVVWTDEGAGGGDTRTEHAEFTLPKYSPGADGSFSQSFSGVGTVTYHSATGCPVTKGSPWSEPFDVEFSSDDGKTGKIKISASDESHSITVACGRGAATYDVEARSLPLTKFPLKDDVKTHYTATRSEGDLTLSYCKK